MFISHYTEHRVIFHIATILHIVLLSFTNIFKAFTWEEVMKKFAFIGVKICTGEEFVLWKFSNDVENRLKFPLISQRLILLNNIPLCQFIVLVYNIIKFSSFLKNANKSNVVLKEIPNSTCKEVHIYPFSLLLEGCSQVAADLLHCLY
jgi:hypothetical protein